MARVRQLVDNNVKMYKIMEDVRWTFEGTLVVPQQIRNLAQQHCFQIRSGPNATTLIVQMMNAKGIPHTAWYAEDKSLNMLMITSKTAIEMARKWCTVFVMDCTYKTNIHKLPLPQIVGITPTNKTFLAATFHMLKETEEFYTESLLAFWTILKDVAPIVIVLDCERALLSAVTKAFLEMKHLLCHWHIFNNIFSNTKRHVPNKEIWQNFVSAWNLIVNSKTLEDCKAAAAASLVTNFKTESPCTIEYVMKNWYKPYREKFVNYWIDKYPHFNRTSSLRVEGGMVQVS